MLLQVKSLVWQQDYDLKDTFFWIHFKFPSMLIWKNSNFNKRKSKVAKNVTYYLNGPSKYNQVEAISQRSFFQLG